MDRNDLISRSALEEKAYTAVILEPDESGIDYVAGQRFVVDLDDIENAPTVYPICEDKYCKYRANERPQGDLISRSELRKCAIPCLIHNGALTDMCVPLYQIDNAPSVPLPDFKAGYKQAIIDGKLNYGGQVVPDTLQGWRYEDKQITIEEYMQSLKGEN